MHRTDCAIDLLIVNLMCVYLFVCTYLNCNFIKRGRGRIPAPAPSPSPSSVRILGERIRKVEFYCSVEHSRVERLVCVPISS
jgi:hypothetical protein